MDVAFGNSGYTEWELGALLANCNTYSTGATHTGHDFLRFYGFTGGNIWHWLDVDAIFDYDPYVRAYIFNNSQVESLSGTLYFEIYDSSDNFLSNGSNAVGPYSPSSTSNYTDCYYGSGTPSYMKWRWSTSLSWNTIYI